MPKLPVVSEGDVIKVFSKQEFTARNGKGDHIVLQRNDNYKNIIVPLHKELKSGTQRPIIRQSGLTVDEFIILS